MKTPGKTYSQACGLYGTCYNKNGGFYCTCLPGFSGNNCEINIDDCEGVICEGNKVCKDKIDSYECVSVVLPQTGDDEGVPNWFFNGIVFGSLVLVIFGFAKLGVRMNSVGNKKRDAKYKAKETIRKNMGNKYKQRNLGAVKNKNAKNRKK